MSPTWMMRAPASRPAPRKRRSPCRAGPRPSPPWWIARWRAPGPARRSSTPSSDRPGQGGRALAAHLAAHAVDGGEQPEVGAAHEGVLVAVAEAPFRCERRRQPGLPQGARAFGRRSIRLNRRLNAIEREFSSPFESETRRGNGRRDLAAGLESRPYTSTGLASENRPMMRPRVGLDPQLPLVDLGARPVEGHEAGRGAVMGPAQHDARAVGHVGLAAVPLHAQAVVV